MTVSELIALLHGMDPTHAVIMRSGDMGYDDLTSVGENTVTLDVHGHGSFLGPHEVDYYPCGEDSVTVACVVLHTKRD